METCIFYKLRSQFRRPVEHWESSQWRRMLMVGPVETSTEVIREIMLDSEQH